MNFHTRTTIDILNLDDAGRGMLLQVINSEYQLYLIRRRMHGKLDSELSDKSLRIINNAFFSHDSKISIGSEIRLYLKTVARSFLESIGMDWMLRELDADGIDYATISTYMLLKYIQHDLEV